MKQKKTMVLFSFLLCLFSASAYTVYDQQATANGYTWTYRYDTVTGDATIYGETVDVGGDEEYDWVTYPSAFVKGSVTVPSSLGGHTVVGIGELAFANRTELTSVNIPSTVTWAYWGSAFSGCTALQSISVSPANPSFSSQNGVVYDKAVGKLLQCPGGCSSVTIPPSVTSIGEHAFEGCTGLTSVTIPASVTDIGDYAFSGCPNLVSVTFNEGLRKIGYRAFYNCKSLWSVNLPSTVEQIGSSAFEACFSLDSIVIPAGVVSVGDAALRSCPSLTYVKSAVLSQRVYEYVGYDIYYWFYVPQRCWNWYWDEWVDAGYYCSNHPGLSPYLSVSPDDYQKPNIILLKTPDINPVIPEGATCVDYAGNTAITSAELPDTVTHIPVSAFAGCTNLKSVRLNEAIDNIPANAFNGCSKLGQINIPAAVTSIGTDAFGGCSSLTNVSFGDLSAWYRISLPNREANPLNCGGRAYSNGSEITNVKFPSDMVDVGTYQFAGWSGLQSIELPPDTRSIGAGAFWGCSGIADIVIPASVTNIDENAFNGCSGLTAIEIPFGVTSIKQGAFQNCGGLGAVAMPSVKSIGQRAFQNCSGLASMTIPSCMKSVGVDAFAGCTGLSRVEIDDISNWYGIEFGNGCANPLSYGHHLFVDGEELTALNVPDTLTAIGAYAFYNASSIEDVTIPASVLSIGTDAFKGCTGIRTIEIPASYTVATTFPDAYAAITKMKIPDGTAAIAANAYKGCVALSNIVIPESVISIGTDAFRGCTGIRAVELPASYNLATVFPDAYAALEKLTIPEGTTSIAANVFQGCASVSSVEVPASVASIGSGAFRNCANLTSVTFKGRAPACGDNVFTGTSSELVIYAGTGSSGWTQWNGRPLAFVDVGGGEEQPVKPTETAALTVTNVVIHYIVNSVQPEKIIPAIYDSGFVNIITEVKSGGAVSVPITWMVNYPSFVANFGSDFTKALMKPTGKRDGAGNPMFVWQDYVAGTDPTDENDVFTASITTDANGKLIISYTPELTDAEKSMRKYTTWGKKSLTDGSDWEVVEAGNEADYNFFKVTVEMK